MAGVTVLEDTEQNIAELFPFRFFVVLTLVFYIQDFEVKLG